MSVILELACPDSLDDYRTEAVAVSMLIICSSSAIPLSHFLLAKSLEKSLSSILVLNWIQWNCFAFNAINFKYYIVWQLNIIKVECCVPCVIHRTWRSSTITVWKTWVVRCICHVTLLPCLLHGDGDDSWNRCEPARRRQISYEMLYTACFVVEFHVLFSPC